jgi:hypothetical protein
MTGVAIDCNLTDLMFSFPTYIRGTSRNDYILASDWIANSVIAGCYEPFSYRTKGDHRNIVIDIKYYVIARYPNLSVQYTVFTQPSK